MKVLAVMLLLCLISCRSIQYVPVETTKTKTEYKEKEGKDSTTTREELKAKYDSLNVAKRDSIRVPYPVEVIKVKYRVPRSLWWLVILLAGLSVPSILKILRKLKLIKI